MLQCIVVTPERTVFDRPAEFVALTLYDGEIGVAIRDCGKFMDPRSQKDWWQLK